MNATQVNPVNTGQQNTAQNKNPNPPIEDLEIDPETPIYLGMPIEKYSITSDDLAMEIGKKYKPVLKDMHACKITVLSNGELAVKFYFEKRGFGDVIDNFVSESVSSRLRAWDARMSNSRMFDLSDNVKGLFRRFLIPTGQNLNWNNYIFQEVTQPNMMMQTNMTGGHTYTVLTKISLQAILPELLFIKEKIGKRKDVQIRVNTRSLVNMPQQHFNIEEELRKTPKRELEENLFLEVEILDKETVAYLSNKAGMNISYGINMVVIPD